MSKVLITSVACCEIAFALIGRTMSAQEASDQHLAGLLADDSTRQSAIALIVASGTGKIPILLSWAQAPPSEVDEYDLRIGLADAFGALQVKDGIPFLIKNLSIRRTRFVDFSPWLKTPKVIEDTFPAIAALIRIGPDASRALIRAAQEPMLPEDRLASIFAISRIKDVPEARAFLTSALGQANQERYQAEAGLKLLDSTR